MSDLSYREAVINTVRPYLARLVPENYSSDMTDDEVVELLAQVVNVMALIVEDDPDYTLRP